MSPLGVMHSLGRLTQVSIKKGKPMDHEYGNYDDVVKNVYVTILLKVKARITLMESDYNGSDGTDEGAVMAALLEDGICDWDEMKPHTVLSIVDIV